MQLPVFSCVRRAWNLARPQPQPCSFVRFLLCSPGSGASFYQFPFLPNSRARPSGLLRRAGENVNDAELLSENGLSASDAIGYMNCFLS